MTAKLFINYLFFIDSHFSFEFVLRLRKVFHCIRPIFFLYCHSFITVILFSGDLKRTYTVEEIQRKRDAAMRKRQQKQNAK